MGRLRRRATIARKAVAQILETAQEYGFEGEEWLTLARETAALTRALRAIERPDEMEIGVMSLERRQQMARERLELLLGAVESDPKEAENRPHLYNYNPNPDLIQDTVIAAKGCSGEGEGPHPIPRRRFCRDIRRHSVSQNRRLPFAGRAEGSTRGQDFISQCGNRSIETLSS